MVTLATGVIMSAKLRIKSIRLGGCPGCGADVGSGALSQEESVRKMITASTAALAVLVSLMGLSTARADEPLRVYIASDSTATDYGRSRLPQMGWGQVLQCGFSDKVEVRDFARGGRSTRTFISEGRWSWLAGELRPGDTLLIQFGHNDAAQDKPERYASPDDYERNLRMFVNIARQQGATPVLLTPVTRRQFGENGQIVETHGDYSVRVRKVAADMNVALVDLDEASRRYFSALGEQASLRYFLHYTAADHIATFPDGVADNTHFSEAGARAVAGLVIQGLATLETPVSAELRQEASGLDPQHSLGGPVCGP